MTTFHIISLFPESFESYLAASIVKRAREDGQIDIKYYNPRDFTEVPEGRTASYADRRVDNRPYGGGPGMVIEAMPVIRAIEMALQSSKKSEILNSKQIRNSKSRIPKSCKIIFFVPSAKQFTNATAESWKKYSDIILICGRYEGIDARIKKAFPMTEISIGPFVLTGGELPAMIVIDAITRRLPGVLGHDESVEELRTASPDVYTRPEVIEYNGKKFRVPKVLVEGHHAKIEAWKKGKLGK